VRRHAAETRRILRVIPSSRHRWPPSKTGAISLTLASPIG
jgi:hypothetical protein